MDNILIKQVTPADAEYSQVYDLREEILRKPIGLSLKNEDLGGDALDAVLCAMSDNKVIGCLMIHPTDEEDTVKLRQMAVATDWQGKSIGKLLMAAAERLVWDEGRQNIVLHARTTAEGFYEKLGYNATSDVFTEVGIPHVVMKKERC